ncbi:MAG: hypothetical protein Q4B68_07375 [Bacteroidales bacterium]|nr:hypothetical protein [Bacteroidales bacterium]
MKKTFLMLAMALVLGCFSCSAATTMNVQLKGVSGGDWDSFRPALGVAKLTVLSEEGDMVNVAVMAPFEAPVAFEAKGVESAKYQLYYADEKYDNIFCDKLDLDPAEIPAIVEFVKAGKEGVKKEFKFVGKMQKAHVLALPKSTYSGALVIDFRFAEEE